MKATTLTTKEKKQTYLNLYGLDVLHLMLTKNGYNYYSFANKSIPTQGSPTYKINDYSTPLQKDVEKVIVHTKEDKITLLTNSGNVQYLKL